MSDDRLDAHRTSLDSKGPYATDVNIQNSENVTKRLPAAQAQQQETPSEDDDALDSREDDALLGETSQATVVAGSRTAGTAEAADTDQAVVPLPTPPAKTESNTPISWSSLPKKGQLAILTLARLSEPLTQTSLQSYMFYQLKSFKNADGHSPSDATVASQAGLLAAAFTGAQFLTAMLWGRISDSERMGRKRVILIGLLGTAIGSLGFGFSTSFRSAVFWRCIGGMLNGNIGVMRTSISEIIREKKFQSRAFLLLPLTFNIGVIIGPILGGLLADPVTSYPGLFGPGSHLGGKDGVYWLMTWPYALPNVVNAVFLTLSSLAMIFGFEETLEACRDKPDYPLQFTRWLIRLVQKGKSTHSYSVLNRDLDPRSPSQDPADSVELGSPRYIPPKPKTKQKLPFRRMWTRRLCLMLLSHGLLAMHVGTFNQLWFVFLSTPRYDPDNTTTPSNSTTAPDTTLEVPANYHPHPPFTFTGGLALPPPSIGTALAILGVIGISLQLLLYPRLSFRLGTTKSYHTSLLLFPLAYLLVPYLATLPSSSSPPHQASGALIWMGITFVLVIQVMARTFALPSAAILMNNSCPHPSVLGTVHGLGQSVSSGTRTIGPVLFGWLYGVGLGKGMVGLAWWSLACVASVGAFSGRWVTEGNGHDILLEGEEEEKDDEGGAGGTKGDPRQRQNA